MALEARRRVRAADARPRARTSPRRRRRRLRCFVSSMRSTRSAGRCCSPCLAQGLHRSDHRPAAAGAARRNAGGGRVRRARRARTCCGSTMWRRWRTSSPCVRRARRRARARAEPAAVRRAALGAPGIAGRRGSGGLHGRFDAAKDRRPLPQRGRSPPISIRRRHSDVRARPSSARSQPARRPTRDRLGALDRRLPSASPPRADRRDRRQADRRGAANRRRRRPRRSTPSPTPIDAEEERRRRLAGASRPPRRARPGGRRARKPSAEEREEAEEEQASRRRSPPAAEEEIVEGIVELLPNGSGFVRVAFPEPSDDDVYISAAQVKRCELVSGDRVSGPRRAPRRSERFASLVRIDTINDRPADELADSTRFDDLPAAFPSEPFRFGSEDPTLVAIERLTPIGRGSRVTIVGPTRTGKTEIAPPPGRRSLPTSRVSSCPSALAGVRPEEIAEWSGAGAPTAAVSFAASPDAQDHIVELVVDQARRIAARGADAVVLIDSLDGLHQYAARKALAAARNIVDGGSLTVIATASAPIGGETTVIALDQALASLGRFPSLDLSASGTIRAAALVGEAGAEEIVRCGRRSTRPAPVSRRCTGCGGVAPPCSGAPVPGTRATGRSRRRSCPAGGRASSSTAWTAHALISTSSGEPCSISSSASIRADQLRLEPRIPSRRSTWGTRLSANIVSRSRSCEGGDAARAPGRRRRSAPA